MAAARRTRGSYAAQQGPHWESAQRAFVPERDVPRRVSAIGSAARRGDAEATGDEAGDAEAELSDFDEVPRLDPMKFRDLTP